MTKVELAQAINESCFRTESLDGGESEIRFSISNILADSDLTEAVAEHLFDLVPESTQVLVASNLSGAVLASTLSRLTGLELSLVYRKPTFEDSRRYRVEGAFIHDKNVCLVRLALPANSRYILDSADYLRSRRVLNTNCLDIVSAVDWEDGVLDQELVENYINSRAIFHFSELQQPSIRAAA